jgi:hypothetical protein
MNPLESLKEKLRMKPQLGERSPVIVVIKGNDELKIKTVIVDSTHKRFDRDELFNKLAKLGVDKVRTKNAPEAKTQSEPIVKNTKMVRKLGIRMKLRIEETVVPLEEEKEKDKEKGEKEKTLVTTKPRTKKGKDKAFYDALFAEQLPVVSNPINLKASSYYMNNREIFINFITSTFKPYMQELKDNKDSISCDNIGQSSSDFSLLTHQKIVRDYINLYTPYRGLLLYHGLGSGKTCTSIAIAEGMKNNKRVIVMTPASLRMNYMEELKKCGDHIYKKNQYWEFISTKGEPESAKSLASAMNLPLEYITKRKGAWLVNVKKAPNYSELSSVDKESLDDQLNKMIEQKYTFINYNGLRIKQLEKLTDNFSNNLFDDRVIIIDEAHNLISRIVNKIKKEPAAKENDKGEKEHSPKFLSNKLYEYLLSAKNAKIVLLSGTPVINYPNEFGILFNILRGYIKTWKISLDIKTSAKIDKGSLREMIQGEKTLDYLDYSPSSRLLTITRNPFGFKNKIKKDSGYQGVKNDDSGILRIENEFTSDDDFERQVRRLLSKGGVDIAPNGIKISNQKALPDDFDLFNGQYIDSNTNKLKNVDSLKRRIVGLSSFFKSAQESLLPRYDRASDSFYHVERIPMSGFQFKIYESARHKERDSEKQMKNVFEEQSSTYRIFSRLFCNFVMPNRPMPPRKNKKGDNDMKSIIEKGAEVENKIDEALEGEVEGDQVLDEMGGKEYKEQVQDALQHLKENYTDFLTEEKLQIYGPKYLSILRNIQNPEHQGLHLIYSQFRTLEGVGVFSLVLEKNGFARFKIKKNSGVWELDISEEDKGKPTYALYTGTEDAEEKEIIRNIYNGDWNYVPTSISTQLEVISKNNNLGEIIRVLMITSSGSEGINLRNTRYVHIMEPYWHPVRSEQVIGRARRICSHKDLPLELQTVEVFVYLMVFSEEQLNSEDAKELKLKDKSKLDPKHTITSDEYLYEISEIKSKLTMQLTDAIKESAFDCYIYSNGKCFNFSDPTNDKFAYVPDYTEQQSDITAVINKQTIEWSGQVVPINGVDRIARRMSKKLLYIYDLDSYKQALQTPGAVPVQIGTLELDSRGEMVYKDLV